MIKLIIGNKGSGKTKKLVELVNDAANTAELVNRAREYGAL